MSLPGGYRLVDGPPAVGDYLELRLRAGLSPKRPDQAAAAIDGAWAAVHVVSDPGGTVGMGRVLGDGGWYFHVLDMAPSTSDAISATPSSPPSSTASAETPHRCLCLPHGRPSGAQALPATRLPAHGAWLSGDGATP